MGELDIFPFLGEFSSAEVISIDRDELRLDLRERPTAGGKWSRAEKRVGWSIVFFIVGQIGSYFLHNGSNHIMCMVGQIMFPI